MQPDGINLLNFATFKLKLLDLIDFIGCKDIGIKVSEFVSTTLFSSVVQLLPSKG